MRVLQRIRRLTTSRVESFLQTVEDPELLFPQLIREMEEQVRDSTTAEAKALAGVKASQRVADEVQTKLDRMVKGAEMAMASGDEETARAAVEAQIKIESEVTNKADALARAKESSSQAKAAREEVMRQLDELRSKKEEILTRARVAKNQKRVDQTISSPVNSSASILDAVAQLETKVEESEAELEVKREMGQGVGQPSLEKRLASMEQASEVEKRLAALKAKPSSE
jgi:phage shock protein A